MDKSIKKNHTPLLTVIPLQGEFTDLNTYVNAERTNRFLGAKIKKEETERVAWEVKKYGKLKGKFEIHFAWLTKNERKDPDNVSFAKKFILDGFVTAGLLEDDTRKTITRLSDSFHVDKSFPHVVITLKRVE